MSIRNILEQSSKLKFSSCYVEITDDEMECLDGAWSWNCAAFFANDAGVLGFIGGIADV